MLSQVLILLFTVHLAVTSDFAENLATCAKKYQLNTCLRQTLEDLRPLMKKGIPDLKLPPTEPMKVASVNFAQGKPPVQINAAFSNVVVRGLSGFKTNYIEADPTTQTLRISLTVPEMNITGRYKINGEVFIFPLEGSGNFSTKMKGVAAVGQSNILPTIGAKGKQVLRVDNSDLNFDISKVEIHMDNLFNGDNELLAETVNKFLNDHGQDVLAEVKPEISKQLTQLVTRVMNDAFSKLPADKLLNNLNRSSRSGHSSRQPIYHSMVGFNKLQERRGKRIGLFSLLHGGKK